MILCLWGVGGREGVRLVKVYGGGECMCVFVHVCVCVFVVFPLQTWITTLLSRSVCGTPSPLSSINKLSPSGIKVT